MEYVQWSFESGPTSESVTFLNRKPTTVVCCFANALRWVLKKTEREWLVPELPLAGHLLLTDQGSWPSQSEID